MLVVNFAPLQSTYTRWHIFTNLKNCSFLLIRVFLILLLAGGGSFLSVAQPSTLPMTPQRDTSRDKTNNGKWKNEEARITAQKLNSIHNTLPDTNIHTYHRRPFVQPWARDMGNPGSPINNLYFTPENRVGPTLGYHVFDQYKFNIDSLNYFNTDRPYSVFSYQTAGRQEHVASILHTQNIKPNWNFAVEYRKLNSPGYYKIQRNNHDNFYLTTNYKSLNQRYKLNAAMVYNLQQHDENGGVVNIADLDSAAFNNRKTINTAFQSEQYSATRSSVSNVLREFTVLIQNSYSWGNTDTTYDENDTAAYTYKHTPRFSITHNTRISTEEHRYKDLTPDSTRYTPLFTRSFPNKGSGYYGAGGDSVFTRQKWFWVDNKILLNGYVGKADRQLQFTAGAGIRYDQFISDPVSKITVDSPFFRISYDRRSIASSYIEGQIKREAATPTAWEYQAATRFIFAGQYAGNFALNASLSKHTTNNKAFFIAGFSQQLGSAPYNYSTYQNAYSYNNFQLSTESVTNVYAMLSYNKLRLQGGAGLYLLNNYIYLANNQLPAQYTVPFSIPQVWLRKVFRMGNFYLDNELVYQLVDSSLPVNIPSLMGRHQFSFERALFKNAIKIVLGVEGRYNTAYNPAGYSTIMNRFYNQSQVNITNTPELSAFLNFRIKRFRAFIMVDNLQQRFARNAVLYTGVPIANYSNTGKEYVPVYATPNTMLRFGFNWAMVN